MLSIFNKWKSSSKLVKWSSIIILLIIISLTIFLPIYFLVIKKSNKSDDGINNEIIKNYSKKCPNGQSTILIILKKDNCEFDLSTKTLKINFDGNCNCLLDSSADENCNCIDNTSSNIICVDYLNKLLNESKKQNKKICGVAKGKTNCISYLGGRFGLILDTVSISSTNNNEFIFKFKELLPNIKSIDDIIPLSLIIGLECDELEIDGKCQNLQYFLDKYKDSY
jgi:hypothetical protein